MSRIRRVCSGNLIYHVINRANGRRRIFESDADYLAFERILAEARARVPVRILAYCLMPNHWHLVLWPSADGDLSRFARWMTVTHTQRRHVHRNTVGTGHLYQGRFKSFVIQTDHHFLTVCRYVEANARRAGLVKRAEDWRWSSLWRRGRGSAADHALLARWPSDPVGDWIAVVNEPQKERELSKLRESVVRNRPFGDDVWTRRTAESLGLGSTLRPHGRPARQPSDAPAGT